MLQFGKNLRRRARELKLTDAEVARRSGINERRYGFYVTGEREPDLATLVRIANVLQSAIDDLLVKDERARTEIPLRREILLSAATELTQENFDLVVKLAETLVRHQRSLKLKKTKG